MKHSSRIRRFGLGILASMALAACGGSTASSPAATAPPTPTPAPVVVTSSDATHGTFLVAASNSMTLYTFTHDSPGVSACSGQCLVVWPALTVPAATSKVTGGPGITGTLAIITRSDGVLQISYNGLPLYFFDKDTAVGDVKGVYPSWVLAKP